MIQLEFPIQWIFAFIVVFVRVSLIVVFFPLFGDGVKSTVIKALFAAAISLALVPGLGIQSIPIPDSLGRLALMIVPDAGMAAAIGLAARLLLESIRAAGQNAGIQMGFMMANVVDPTNNSQITLVAQLWQIAGIFVFFVINGHHVMIEAIASSFEILPPMGFALRDAVFPALNRMMVDMFVMVVQISAPIVAAMILVNVCLGLVNKVVPQMHVFMESFPLRILLGLWMLTTLSGVFVIVFERVMMKLDGYILTIFQVLAP